MQVQLHQKQQRSVRRHTRDERTPLLRDLHIDSHSSIGALHNAVAREGGLISRARIQAYCAAIAREFRPKKIILFGSYAYGQPNLDSDVDLLVILSFRGNDVTKAAQIRSRFDTPFPMDLLVRKPEFIIRRQRERDMFIEWVMTRGLVMYEDQHA